MRKMATSPPSGRKPVYILFFKPFGVLSQFRRYPGKKSLADFGPFPRSVHPVGRLDEDSEGLLLLTDDGKLAHRILDPLFAHRRTYLVQVDGVPDEQDLARLRGGIVIDGARTLPAGVRSLNGEPLLPPRNPPIRFRKNIPTTWVEMTLHEGRNRQVRRMTAAVGHPTLRLVRVSLAGVTLGRLNPGEYRLLTDEEVGGLRRKSTGGEKRRLSGRGPRRQS